ncbi:transmembrane protein 88B isoform X2 [Hyaena hyaena]|uniref:transmembrane protein 88B isoform X2 n=1 Tax=Hyaena hyaena TaxID=95912 RepID=UPI001922A900|nr:transmembrane protein 88B isoform X2 [Hyaena hyaena]
MCWKVLEEKLDVIRPVVGEGVKGEHWHLMLHTLVTGLTGWVGLTVRGLGTLLLPGQALAGLLLRLLLPATVFLLALLPAAAIVYVGFLCHSRVHPAPRPACRALLSDRGAAALIVLGFLSLPPLLVLASAARTRLTRSLRPLLPPPTWTPGPRRLPGSSDSGGVGRRPDGEEQFCAWV